MPQESNRNIFVIRQNAPGAEPVAYSNRQLVYKWIEKSNAVAFMERAGKPPKQITSYTQLCRCLEKTANVRLLVIQTGQEPARYNVNKLPLISK